MNSNQCCCHATLLLRVVHVIKFLPFCYFLVCLEMHFVGNGDCIENDLLALSYHYLLKNVIFVETSQLKCHRPIVQNKRL